MPSLAEMFIGGVVPLLFVLPWLLLVFPALALAMCFRTGRLLILNMAVLGFFSYVAIATLIWQ
jgi:hypothetical protein